MAAELPCCYIYPGTEDACTTVADFEIIDVADPRPGVLTLHACEAHVGAMLTHEPDAPIDLPWEWLVRALSPSQGSGGQQPQSHSS